MSPVFNKKPPTVFANKTEVAANDVSFHLKLVLVSDTHKKQLQKNKIKKTNQTEEKQSYKHCLSNIRNVSEKTNLKNKDFNKNILNLILLLYIHTTF